MLLMVLHFNIVVAFQLIEKSIQNKSAFSVGASNSPYVNVAVPESKLKLQKKRLSSKGLIFGFLS